MTTVYPQAPLIPGSANLTTLEVSKAKIFELIGPGLSGLNTWKGSVRSASTGNLTLSGEQTVDGVALVADDTILVKNQTTASENGLYTVQQSTWYRSDDLVEGSDAAGVAVFVNEGTSNADSIWVCTDDTGSATVGTDNLTFATITTVIGAAGSDTQVQFNSSGALAGDAGLIFNSGTGTLTATTLSDGIASLNSGNLINLGVLTASGTVTGGTLTDGALSSTAGTVTGGVAATFSGAVTGGTLTDGALSSTGGTVTGGVAATFSGAVTGGTLTDGTLSSTAGAVTGVDTIVIDKANITQATDITTGVTINSSAGTITTVTATVAALTSATFTVTNSDVTATSVVVANTTSYSGTIITNGTPTVSVANIGAGSFDINVVNIHPTNALNGTIDIQFIVV